MLLFLVSVLSVSQAVGSVSEEAGFEMEHKIWSMCNSTTGYCTCGEDIKGILSCIGEEVSITICYCAYRDISNSSIVGNCLHTCFNDDSSSLVFNRSAVMFFNEIMCEVYNEPLHREGRFCGRCKEGYGLAAYFYHYISCVSCRHYGYKNYVRYVTVAFLPLTIFYFLVVTLRINVLSSRVTGIIFVLQCLFSPENLYVLDGWGRASVGSFRAVPELLSSIFRVVNLDFFRLLYPHFCLHPKLNILHILSLDYLVALYPFLLIFITYLLVTLYDRNYRVIVWAWKPFKWCLRRYQKEFIVKSSLIETFATFILLSSVKILNTSLSLLTPTRIYDETGARLNKQFMYVDANIEFFGREHLPFAVLALMTGFIFYLFPLLLLAFYPCHCFQKCLNVLGWRCRALHVFMDAFQGSYKTEPHDLRSFSAFFFFLRFLLLFSTILVLSSFYFFIFSLIMLTGTIIFSIVQPYKSSSHNKYDLIILLSASLLCFAVAAQNISYRSFVNWLSAADVILLLCFLFFLGLLFGLLFKTLLSKFRRLHLSFFKIALKMDSIEAFDREGSVQYPLLHQRH